MMFFYGLFLGLLCVPLSWCIRVSAMPTYVLVKLKDYMNNVISNRRAGGDQ